MKERIDGEIVRALWGLRAMPSEEAAVAIPRRPAMQRRAPMLLNDPGSQNKSAFAGAVRAEAPEASPFGAPPTSRKPARVGGDDATPKTVGATAEGWKERPLPCGSGKKYKKCHGANLQN